MKHIKKYQQINESNNITKVSGTTIVYFDLFPLLKGLEKERPGIKKRVWDFICDDPDVAFKPYKGRISNINLYYYGIGDEYPTKYLEEYPQDLERSKLNHPFAFDVYGKKENIEYQLRLDLNLILSVYEDQISDIEAFPVLVSW